MSEIGTPSSEEQLLIAMRDGAYAIAAETMLGKLVQGESPSLLAVANPTILLGMAEELWPTISGAPAQGEGYKADLFLNYLNAAQEGDPAAISALPKFATSLGELAAAVELTLDNRSAITDWRTGRPYVQYIGSFNPMHVGHRTLMASTLEVAGPNSSVMVQAVADHPKKSDLPPYRMRFANGEEKLNSSDIIDPTRATFIDVPLSLGLAKVGAEQIRLLAQVTGDPKMRWQLGSDKFMTDVRNVQAGKELDKAGTRFRDVHMYVARRNTESAEEIAEGVAYLRDTFGSEVTVLPEHTDALVVAAAASTIRSLRAEGRNQEADEMEFRDLYRRPGQR